MLLWWNEVRFKQVIYCWEGSQSVVVLGLDFLVPLEIAEGTSIYHAHEGAWYLGFEYGVRYVILGTPYSGG